MMARISGIHHVTAIAGEPQENIDFYAGVLGMRMVKRSVNQDDPRRYHLFYADAEGHPGTDLTFFPWPGGAEAREGTGATNEVVFAVPPDSVPWWHQRLEDHDVEVEKASERFGEPTLRFRDPHGLRLAIAGTDHADQRPFAAWEHSTVPEEHQLRGLHAVRILERWNEPTMDLLTDVMGMEEVAQEDGWTRLAGRDNWSGYLELREDEEAPRASGGVGSVHHVAWRVDDDEAEVALQQAVRDHGLSTTPVIDRFWFESVYFREPGGVLFELATDGPGFGIDEPLQTLGETLVLPPWLEEKREDIVAALPPIDLPHKREDSSGGPQATGERP